MAWRATWRGNNRQILAKQGWSHEFAVKTADWQEVYIGWADKEEFAANVYTTGLKFEYIPIAKSIVNEDAEAGVIIEIIKGAYQTYLTWATRPTSVINSFSTLYNDIVINRGIGFTITDTNTIKLLLRNQAHIRIRAKGNAENGMKVVIGDVYSNNTLWSIPYYTVMYEVPSSAKGTMSDSTAPQLAVFNDTNITIRSNAYSYIQIGAIKGTSGASLKLLKVQISTDNGVTWSLIRDFDLSDGAIPEVGGQTLGDLPFVRLGIETGWLTQGAKAYIKVWLYDKNNKYSYWQGSYVVQSTVYYAPRVKIWNPNYEYKKMSEGVAGFPIQWYGYASSETNSPLKYWAVYIQNPTNAKYELRAELATDYQTSGLYFWPNDKTLFEGHRKIKVRVADANGAYGEDETEVVVIKIPAIHITALQTVVRPICTLNVSTNLSGGTWEVKIDNKSSYYASILPIAGDGKGTHTVDTILKDGEHTFATRAINKNGDLSNWAIANARVKNTPGAAITLSYTASDHKVTLSWATAGTYDKYWIYRDGKEIGRTASTQYTDEYAAPTSHTYTVYGIMMAADGSGGDYTLSNAVTAALKISGAVIAAADTGGALEWLSLRLGTDVERAVSRSVVQDVTYTHYAGRDLPVAELSEYRDESYSGTVVLTSPDDRAQFEALLGHEVCFKRRGISVTGMMAELSSRHTRARYDAEYTFTIRAIDSEVR